MFESLQSANSNINFFLESNIVEANDVLLSKLSKLGDLNLNHDLGYPISSKYYSNLDFIYKQDKQIILRCPIIPGINDTSEHFEAIAQLEKQYPKIVGIEIMPYHNWGSYKYEQLGMGAYTINSKTVDDKQVEEWLTILEKLGCRKVKRG